MFRDRCLLIILLKAVAEILPDWHGVSFHLGLLKGIEVGVELIVNRPHVDLVFTRGFLSISINLAG